MAAFQLTKTNDNHLEPRLALAHLPKSCAICAINKFAVQAELEKEQERYREKEGGSKRERHVLGTFINHCNRDTAGNCQLAKAKQIINLKMAANVAVAN